ncbi:hypothetical protein KQX54_012682 [Cotesia glomerata]|uniref:Uncharacterized protein n=1 Tax=Cotesia glomerata TaxID=32391 RepID=A0AAV7I999_COTGL|nr:hypothetical protein KQX54_012682 [Cotesia glomerata]
MHGKNFWENEKKMASSTDVCFDCEKRIKGTYDWKCQSCKFEVSIIDSDDKNEEDSYTNISLSVAKSIEELFKKYLAPFSDKISALESSIQGIRSDMNNTEGQLLSFDDIIVKIMERQKNETKVVVFNVLESAKPVGIDRLNDDRKQIVPLLPGELSTAAPKFKLRRQEKQPLEKLDRSL